MPRRHVIARLFAGAALAAGLLLGACSAPTDQAPAASSAQTPPLTPSAFAEAARQPGTIIIDVRTPEEFAAGHLAGAGNIDVEAATFGTTIAGLDKDARYAVYCRSGRRSATAVRQMRAAGFADVVDLAGGVNAWTAAGGALTTS